MITAQDKILSVANKLGLTSLQNMQGSTGAVYDVDLEGSGQIFTNASRHINPRVTNVIENQFEVNEALLIETIGFYVAGVENSTLPFPTIAQANNFQRIYGSNAVIVFDVIVGNKRVCKDLPIFGSGSPYVFANTGVINALHEEEETNAFYVPRHQVYMEGVGILIPPQVQFSVQYNLFNAVTGAIIPIQANQKIACYLYGTRVLLNFNTSI